MIWLALLGCGGGAVPTVAVAPEPVGDHECAVCGMTVADQPAPHGQIVYHDGTHAFTCSLGDLRVAVQTPNPLGPPVEVFVEDLGAPGESWIPAGTATFVGGVDRPLVMGLPLLSYADRATAERVADDEGGTVFTWDALRDTPFSRLPP